MAPGQTLLVAEKGPCAWENIQTKYIYSYFIFDLFREGSPSTEVVFQGALQ